MNLIATILIGTLGIISIVTLGVLVKVFLASTKAKKMRIARAEEAERRNAEAEAVRKGSGITLSGNSPAPLPERKPAPKPAPVPEPEVNIAKKVLEEEDVDPVAEAEVFVTYGLNDKAIEVLERHLATNPTDEAAKKMLAEIKA